MDGLTLLVEARAAGLKVTTDGPKLVVRGPRHLEPLAKQLLANKPAVVAALEAERTVSRLPAWCQCGSLDYVDVPIHGGRSVRRDCAACNRFLEFVKWYGRILRPSEN